MNEAGRADGQTGGGGERRALQCGSMASANATSGRLLMTWSNRTPVARVYSSIASPHHLRLYTCATSICQCSAYFHAMPSVTFSNVGTSFAGRPHGAFPKRTSSCWMCSLPIAPPSCCAATRVSLSLACRTPRWRFSFASFPLSEWSMSLR